MDSETKWNPLELVVFALLNPNEGRHDDSTEIGSTRKNTWNLFYMSPVRVCTVSHTWWRSALCSPVESFACHVTCVCVFSWCNTLTMWRCRTCQYLWTTAKVQCPFHRIWNSPEALLRWSIADERPCWVPVQWCSPVWSPNDRIAAWPVTSWSVHWFSTASIPQQAWMKAKMMG